MWISLSLLVLLVTLACGAGNAPYGVVYRSSPEFTVELPLLTLGEYVKGGSGGVYILAAGQNKYTMKFSKDLSHFQEEVLADKLYSVLGVSTPQFVVVNNFSQLSTEIQMIIKYVPFVRIAEFIQKDGDSAAQYEDLLQSHFEEHFVIDAFMANRDANKEGNNILHAGKIYRIDNGGSLRNRAIGKKKGTKRSDAWDAYLLPELKSLIKFNPTLYKNITELMIHEQAKAILAKVVEIADAFHIVAASIAMDADAREHLAKMLAHRFHMLEMILHPGVSYPADLHRPVSALTGAGTFLICDIDKVPHVLLGARRSAHAENDYKWASLGGKGDFGKDKSFVEIASRELYEETMGLVDLRRDYDNASFHDFLHEDYLFRQYFLFVSGCLDAGRILTNELPHSLRHNEHVGKKEYHAFQWFPVALLRNATPEGTFGPKGEQTYHAFTALLHIDRVQAILRAIVEHSAFPEPKHAQSTAKKGALEHAYGTFISVTI